MLVSASWSGRGSSRPTVSRPCAIPIDRAAYGRLCRLLTLGNRRAIKGQCQFSFEEMVAAFGRPDPHCHPAPAAHAGISASAWPSLAKAARGRVYLAARFGYRGDERRRLADTCRELATCSPARSCLPQPTRSITTRRASRWPMCSICIREKCTIAEAGFRLEGNAERHLKPAAEMARLFADYPKAVARSLEIAQRITFDLEELRYEYPDEPVPAGKTPQGYLEELTWRFARRALSRRRAATT